jgi:hypothetical protein
MPTDRASAIQSMPPLLVADVWLYPTSEGGKRAPAQPGWGCPCCPSTTLAGSWDGWPQLDTPLAPGEKRRVGFVFLSGDEAASQLRQAGRFYLWEGRFVGEATILE